MYQALYRKWRPAVFEDVAGQPAVTATLRGEVEAGRIGHAYLFTGSRGTGKTTCAKILAKAVNCLHPNHGDPCNECEACRGIDAGTILDVTEIDAASNNGVDNIRELREEAAFTPVAAKYRVYIIDEAHMLSTGAFNALLKTLEEPPAYVIFILATTEAHKIPVTILSRCQRFDFRRIPPGSIAKRLLTVAQGEGFTLTDDAANLIARLADGALRDALSLLDQCAAAGGDITAELVAGTAGLSGREYLFEITEAVLAHDAGAALRVVDRLYNASKDCERLCEELLSHFRAVMLLQTTGEETALPPMPADELGRLKQAAAKLTAPALLHILTALEASYERMRRSPSARIELETCLLHIALPELDTSPEALLRRVSALEASLAQGIPARVPAREAAAASTAAPEPAPPTEEAPAAPARPARRSAPDPEAAGPAEPLGCWPQVVEEIYRIDGTLRGVLSQSEAVRAGDVISVYVESPMFAELIKQQAHQKALVEAIRSVTGEALRVRVARRPLKTAADPLDRLSEAARSMGFDGA